MTVEEALVALLAAVAGVLLFIGLAQALADPPDAVDGRPRRRAGASRPGRAVTSTPPSTGPVARDPSRSGRVLTGDD